MYAPSDPHSARKGSFVEKKVLRRAVRGKPKSSPLLSQFALIRPHPLSSRDGAALPSRLLFADHTGPQEVWVFIGVKRPEATGPVTTGSPSSQGSL